jgi:hypothetical protein
MQWDIATAARETRGLGRIVGLQAANIIALEPLNLILAWLEQLLLRRPWVKQYLQAANANLP